MNEMTRCTGIDCKSKDLCVRHTDAEGMLIAFENLLEGRDKCPMFAKAVRNGDSVHYKKAVDK